MNYNIGLALFPWLNGRLRVLNRTYEASLVMFSLLGAGPATEGSVVQRPGT